jgi:hypothetical protein
VRATAQGLCMSAAKSLRRRKPKLHPLVQWMRGAGAAAVVFGGGGALLTDWFWPGVIAVYAGFLLLAVDVWCEPELSSRWRIRITFFLGASAAAFSWWIVFVPAPLSIGAAITNATYPPGTKVAGITFRSEFTELRVFIQNSSTESYDDLNLLIQPTDPNRRGCTENQCSQCIVF